MSPQAYMSSVFDVVDSAVVEARRIGPVISEATTIINRDVNTTDILASIAVRRTHPLALMRIFYRPAR